LLAGRRAIGSALTKVRSQVQRPPPALDPPVHLRACIGVDRDLDLIGHLLEHYRSLGIRHYHLILHTTDARGPALDRARRRVGEGCAGLDCDVRTWVTADFRANDYKKRLDEIIRDLDDEDWVLSVEADEFQVYPDGLQAVLDACTQGGFDCVSGVFVERFPLGPRLETLRVDVPLWQQCPRTLASRPVLGNVNKVVLHRKAITLTSGNHQAAHGTPRLHPRTVAVHHFRWFDNIYRKLDSNRSHAGWASERDERLRFIRKHLPGERAGRKIRHGGDRANP
jgi:hypothetical protein